MPVPTIVDPPPSAGGKPPGQPVQKPTTKAERTELQEKQRAAKAALKQQPQAKQQPGGNLPAANNQQKPKVPVTPQKKAFITESVGTKHTQASKDAALSGAPAEDNSAKQISHGLRIFSHFGQPKPIGHTVKGDIHPAIIRLGLMFSEFKICGSNARCIAMLTAFKQVRSILLY